jgi:hypothetical protein
MMPEEAPAIRIYLDYDYLAAQQLGQLLLGMHGLFDEIQYADAPYLRQLPSAPAARLRIEHAETGGSIVVSFVHGVTQLVGSADPALVSVVSGVTALTATGTLIVRLLSRTEDLRAKWRHNHRVDEIERLEVADKQLDVIAKGRALANMGEDPQFRLDETRAVLAEYFPARPAERQATLAERLAPHLDAITQIIGDDNIRGVQITLPHQDA